MGGPIKVLYDFQLVVDTDFGVIKYIKTNPNLNKPAFFKPALIQGSDKNIIKNLLRRESLNPLDAFARAEMIGQLNKVYEELMTTPDIYKKILKLSHPTLILTLLKQSIEAPNSAIIPYVMYYNDDELKFLTEFLSVPKSSCVQFTSQMDMSEYGSIFIKKYKNILQFDISTVKGKNIYISNHEFNMHRLDLAKGDQIIPNAAVTKIIGNTNIINIVEIYKMEELK